jgi:hypothetical protein
MGIIIMRPMEFKVVAMFLLGTRFVFRSPHFITN